MLELLWLNKKIIAEVTGCIVIAFFCWWFFVHNPAVIKDLEEDKAELARQVESGKKALTLLNDIEKGKAKINEATFKNISTIRAAAIPKRTVLISGGVPLSGVR